MRTYNLIKLTILFTAILSLSSCAVVGGIFKTGMGVGAIAVIAIIVLILFFIFKSGKK
jgi:uncharacterized membrane protein YoaK (UPF0700 family)